MTPSICVVIETSNRCAVDVWLASAVYLTSQQQDPVHYAHHYRHIAVTILAPCYIPFVSRNIRYHMHGADGIAIPLSDQGVRIRAVRKSGSGRKRRKRQKKGPISNSISVFIQSYGVSTVGLNHSGFGSLRRWLESCMEDGKQSLLFLAPFLFSSLQTKTVIDSSGS